MKYAYSKLIPLQLQIWLATNTYKGSNDPKALSATAFLKAVKSLILAGRAQDMVDEAVSNGDFSALQALNKPNLLDVLKSRMGTAMHDSAEFAWETNYRQAFKDLGYTDAYIDRIVLNPEPEDTIPKDAIVVYTEKRLEREIDGFVVSGEADFIFNGVIQDLKTTSTYAFKYADDEKHKMQMSIYKWIFEDHGIHVDDIGQINYLFLDWSKIAAARDPKYPPLPTVGVEVVLHDSEYDNSETRGASIIGRIFFGGKRYVRMIFRYWNSIIGSRIRNTIQTKHRIKIEKEITFFGNLKFKTYFSCAIKG